MRAPEPQKLTLIPQKKSSVRRKRPLYGMWRHFLSLGSKTVENVGPRPPLTAPSAQKTHTDTDNDARATGTHTASRPNKLKRMPYLHWPLVTRLLTDLPISQRSPDCNRADYKNRANRVSAGSNKSTTLPLLSVASKSSVHFFVNKGVIWWASS